MPTQSLAAAAQAFDALADHFDEKFGEWASVAAQRRTVRESLLRAFSPGARVLEIGGGTGEDALWLANRGCEVLLTDPSPAMVRIAAAKLRPLGGPTPLVVSAENLGVLRDTLDAPLDGAFSNFAALNCVTDLTPVAGALSNLVRAGGRVVIVVFGICTPVEWIVQLARGESRTAFRRFARGDVVARVGGREFSIRYHRDGEILDAFSPWFRLVARRGVGVCVPPSGAEPWISRHTTLLGLAERVDRAISRPFALLGDHVLYEFVRLPITAHARMS
ncbi:MAG: class I SAM-dependent methyltransferase [bacterium]